jgi:hypothetical protein
LAASDAFDSSHIRERSDTTKNFSVRRDPERIFANEIISDYRLVPTTGVYGVTYTKTDAGSVALVATTKRRRLQFGWLYQTGGAERRTDREVAQFTTEPEMATGGFGPAMLTKVPTNQIRLTHDKFTDTAFQIRNISVDLMGKTAMATLWNMGALAGRWKDTGAATWTATAEHGFWGDSNGEPSPGDATSAVGNTWF